MGRVVVQMERTGVPVDLAVFQDIQVRMADRASELRRALADWRPGDINWNSWQQLANWLHGDGLQLDEGIEGPIQSLGLTHSPYCKKGEVPDGSISTDDRALEWIAGHNPEHRAPINALRDLRRCERMARYARDWSAASLPSPDGTWRLYPTFGLASDADTRPGAKTGRFGVKNPALNQVPRNPSKDPAGIRTAFVAPPGNQLVVSDYSQLEVVLLGHLIAARGHSDDRLVQLIRADEDIHSHAARYIYGELAGNASIAETPVEGKAAGKAFKAKWPQVRELTKSGVYGKNYGKSQRGFAWSVFLDSGEPLGLARAAQLDEGLDVFLPGVPFYQAFIRQHIEQYQSITSLFGRWQPLPDARSKSRGLANRAWRQALNWPMQAGGQEVMALALVAVADDPELHSLGFTLALVVHDEIYGWAPERCAERCAARLGEVMCSVISLLCPLRAEAHHGRNWKKAK